jgi:hypothetical protein
VKNLKWRRSCSPIPTGLPQIAPTPTPTFSSRLILVSFFVHFLHRESRISVLGLVTVSEDEHHIYVADVGMIMAPCDYLVNATQQACRGTCTPTYSRNRHLDVENILCWQRVQLTPFIPSVMTEQLWSWGSWSYHSIRQDQEQKPWN